MAADALPQLLKILLPHKATWLRQQAPERLIVSCEVHAPFGPDPLALLDALYDDFPAAVQRFTEAMELDRVDVEGLDPARWAFPRGIRVRRWASRPSAAARIDPVEFRRLHDAAVHGEVRRTVLVSVFLSPSQIVSLLVSEGRPLRDVLAAVPGAEELLAEADADGEASPASRAIHPITGEPYDLRKDVAGPATDLVCFESTGYALRPRRTLLLSPPYFRRRLAMRRGRWNSRSPRPCNNCLGCRQVCPADLYPSRLYHQIGAEGVDEALRTNLTACIQCGLCSFVCPTRLPLRARLAEGIAAASELQEA